MPLDSDWGRIVDDRPRSWTDTLNRIEQVTFRSDALMRETTLGALRGFLRELGDWADDSHLAVGSGTLTAIRPLPLATAQES